MYFIAVHHALIQDYVQLALELGECAPADITCQEPYVGEVKEIDYSYDSLVYLLT